MKILMHYNDYGINVNRKMADSYGGVGYYRIIKIAEHLKKNGFDVTVVGGVEFNKFGDTLEERFDKIFTEFDILWTPYFYNDVSASCMYFMRDKHNKKVVVDIDDNYLDIPESNLLYEEFKFGKRNRAFLSTVLFFADHIVTSTYPLKERLTDHFKSIHQTDKEITVIPNLNDIDDWNFTTVEKNDNKVIIGYSGSTSHKDDLKLVLPSIVKLMQKYSHVDFQIVGLLGIEDAKTFFNGIPQDILNRMGMVGATEMFPDYPEFLAKRGWDIGIAPLVDTPFTRSKSSIKWLEYSMYKIPTVASRVYPYFVDVGGRKTIEDGKTGLLCRKNDWENNLERLILDKDLRKKLGENAYAHIKDNWQYKDSNINEIVNKILVSVFKSHK
jgi:glycosyltransferase involved in cell wall biosynthesis